MIKAVFFDLDGTLYDFFGATQTALQSVSRELELNVPRLEGAFWRGYYSLMEGPRGRSLDPQTALPELIASALRESGASPRSPSPGTCRALARRWMELFLGAIRPFEGVLELLTGLRAGGIEIGVISNGARDFQKLKLEALGLMACFTDGSLFCSGDFSSGKPDPEIFRAALESFSRTAEEALFVGDSPVTDVPGAVKAGLRVIWLNRYGLSRPPGCGGVLQARCFSEVAEMIRDLGG